MRGRGQALRLNVGSNDHYAEGWTNVDRWSLPEWRRPPDFVANVLDGLPFDDGSFTQVYLGHILEHIPYDHAHEVVAECWRLLAPGGRLCVVGPCVELGILTRQPDWLLRQMCVSTSQEREGIGHAWTPTALLTVEVVRRGIDVVPTQVPVGAIQPPEWPNPSLEPWQCAMVAAKAVE